MTPAFLIKASFVLVIILIGVVYVASSSTKDSTSENPPNRPNIVIIMADDLGYDDVSYHGERQRITPNIDAMAYHGMNLQNLYAPPLCSPSRAAFMTGKYPIHTGTQHFVISNEEPWGLPTNITTIAEIFKGAGYSTNLVGKWHLGFAKKEFFPTKRGFDTFYGYMGGFIDYFNRMSRMPIPNASAGYDFRRNLKTDCGSRGTYMTDLLTTEAESIIWNHNLDKSLFLVLNHLAPHTGNLNEPLQAPKDEIEKFNYIQDEKRRIYAAMISRLDESIGNITRALDEKQILNNTIIIFYSDNGAPSVDFLANSGSNYPFRGQKNSPWEGGSRVTGSIWSPLLKSSQTQFKQKMYVGDFLPTLAHAAGIELNSDLELDGIDLWNELVTGTEEPFERDIVHVLDDIDNVVSFMINGFKYINGTQFNGKYDSVLLDRQTEVDPRDKDYARTILNSTTSQILSKYEKNPLSETTINSLRALSEIKCANPKNAISCNPVKEECLYNINADPCEENNLAKLPEYESVLNEMRIATQKYRATASQPGNLMGLASADPSVNGCLWTTYLQLPQLSFRNCSDLSEILCIGFLE